jgi:hypothetical protein
MIATIVDSLVLALAGFLFGFTAGLVACDLVF